MNEYYNKYAECPVRFSPFSVKKTGLVQNQTILRINDYMLICSPYQLSMKQAVLLLILSPQEIKFFQSMQEMDCVLGLVFQKPAPKPTLSLDIPSRVKKIGAVKGKQSVCMIEISFLRVKPDYIQILGEYIAMHDALKEYFDDFKNREITVTAAIIQSLRYNNFAEIFIDGKKIRCHLQSFRADRLQVSISQQVLMDARLKIGETVSVKLYFQLYQFMANGVIEQVLPGKEARLNLNVAIGFIPELIEIMDDYFYREDLNKK